MSVNQGLKQGLHLKDKKKNSSYLLCHSLKGAETTATTMQGVKFLSSKHLIKNAGSAFD